MCSAAEHKMPAPMREGKEFILSLMYDSGNPANGGTKISGQVVIRVYPVILSGIKKIRVRVRVRVPVFVKPKVPPQEGLSFLNHAFGVTSPSRFQRDFSAHNPRPTTHNPHSVADGVFLML